MMITNEYKQNEVAVFSVIKRGRRRGELHHYGLELLDLLLLVGVLHRLRVGLGLGEGGEEQADEQADDGHHHQQFHQREGPTGAKNRICTWIWQGDKYRFVPPHPCEESPSRSP